MSQPNLEEPGTFIHFLLHVVEGVPALSRAQVIFCAVCFDDRNPEEFTDPADIALCDELFGPDVKVIPAKARTVLAMRKGRRAGGSLICGLWCLYAALTTPVSNLGPGERAAVLIVSPRLLLSAQIFRYIHGACQSPLIAPMVESTSSTRTGGEAIINRADGLTVCVEVVAAAEKGVSTRSKTLVAACIDEAALFRDADSVVSDTEILRSINPALVNGGRIVILSTVFGESDECWKKVEEQWNQPTTVLAVKATTLTMRPEPEMRERYERDRAIDEQAADREYLCIPFSGSASEFFAVSSVNDAITDRVQTPLARGTNWTRVGAGCDTALLRDSSSIVIVHREEETFTIAEVLELRPERGRPLKLSEVCKAYAAVLQRHGCNTCTADHHEIEASREYLSPHNVWLQAAPGGNAGKIEAYLLFRKLLNEGHIRIPSNEKKLIQQLKDVRSKAMPGGFIRIISPRKAGHGDIMSACILAVWQLAGNSNPMIELLLHGPLNAPNAAGDRVTSIGPVR